MCYNLAEDIDLRLMMRLGDVMDPGIYRILGSVKDSFNIRKGTHQEESETQSIGSLNTRI